MALLPFRHQNARRIVEDFFLKVMMPCIIPQSFNMKPNLYRKQYTFYQSELIELKQFTAVKQLEILLKGSNGQCELFGVVKSTFLHMQAQWKHHSKSRKILYIHSISLKVVHTGSGVGILALGSPILAHAIAPPFITSSGLAPKKEGFQRTRSANFPTCQKYAGQVSP